MARNHPGSIDRHGDRWRIRLSVAGQRHTFYMEGDTDKHDVQQYAREKDTELRGRAGRGLPNTRSAFSELLQRYKAAGVPGAKKKGNIAKRTRRSYSTSLKAFEAFFVRESGDPQVREVNEGHVNLFLDWREHRSPTGQRRKKALSARSIQKERVALHVLFEYARRIGLVDTNPVTDKTKAPEGDQREPVILTTDQYEALLRACEGRDMLRLYTLVLGETGVRCDSEALWLRWSDVDLERGFLTIESARSKGQRTKSGKSRKVPMTRRLREAIREHMATYRFRTYRDERTRWVFHHELDRRHAKAGARLGSLRRAFYAAAKRAGLPADLRQHDLRHRRVTEWLRDGHPAHKVRKAMGHSDLRTTLAYEHMVEDDLLSLVQESTEDERRAIARG
ncbi:MAG: site-specific integrase [Gemmatimonadota bacterium]